MVLVLIVLIIYFAATAIISIVLQKNQKSGRLLSWAEESSLACDNADLCGYLDRGVFYPGKIGSGL